MKKYCSIVCLFIIAIVCLPKLVLAEETDNVYYFLTYPNGEEVVTTNHDEVEPPKEKLIYTGVTDENGEVVLEGLSDEGELRIIQKVPDNYSAERREITLDLSQSNKNVEFVNFRQNTPTHNPETGQSLLFVVILAMVLLVAFKTFKNDSKKALFLLPIVLGVLAFKVYAGNNRVVITVRDKDGKKLSGVQVEVYALPSNIQAAPAVKFDANGGFFLDGTDVMIVKIPEGCLESCNFSQFLQNLDSTERSYVSENIIGAYRDGYRAQSEHEGLEYPDQFVNGTEVKIKWEENDSAKLVTVDGNGGYYDFHGKKKLSSITGYDYAAYAIAYHFEKENQYSVGADEKSDCSNYNSNGISVHTGGWSTDVNTVYACWNSRPDGIYVNGKLFLGNIDTCYQQSKFRTEDLTFQFNNYEFHFSNLSETSIQFGLLRKKDIDSIGGTLSSDMPLGSTGIRLFNQLRNIAAQKDQYTDYDVEILEVVKDGQTIVSITTDDIIENEGLYSITKTDKLSALATYLMELNRMCSI